MSFLFKSEHSKNVPVINTAIGENRALTDLPEIKKATDLLNAQTVLPPAVIKGVLSSGATMVYGGGSKTNKTFALMDMAVSVSAGQPWWGIDTIQGKVLYMDFELQEAFFKNRLQAIVKAKHVTEANIENLSVWNLRGQATDISDLMPHLEARLTSKDYKLIIIDPIYKVLGRRDENSAGEINSLMNEIDRLAVQTGAAIVCGHHFTKGSASNKESIDRISGSGVFGRSPDAIVIITKHEQENVYSVEATLRNYQRIEPFCVEWSYPLMVLNADLDPANLKRPGASKTRYTTKQLIDALGCKELSRKDWMIEVKRKHGMSERTFDSKVKELVDEKEVTKLENGKYKAAPKDPPRFTGTVIDLGSEDCSSSKNTTTAKSKGAVKDSAAAALS